MVFSSSVFLLFFLPVTVAVYFAVANRGFRNVVLLLASLVFYAWGEPVYVVLMIVSIALNWLFAILIETRSFKGALLFADLAANLAILGFFKYEGFIAQNLNAVLATSIPDLDLPLPIGISFYTLQAVSYIVDVYRGQVPAQRNPLYLGMYIAMFPQLVAGPIVRYSTIRDQILNRRENIRDFCAGLRLFIVGLAKKVLLANAVAVLAAQMLDAGGSQIGVIGAWAGLLAYTFQIYFDFSGYSDMAIGLGKMFGFQYLRNFNYPYISKSITEFWRRWHISLSSFFRDYVYIPLGGNRVCRFRWILNLSVVWVLTGVWHGAAWNYVLWGVFYLAVLLLEKFVWGTALAKMPSFVQHLYTVLVFMFAWLLFWIEDMAAMGEYLLAMVGMFGLTGAQTFWQLSAWCYLPLFCVCAMASAPLVPWVRFKVMAWATGASDKRGFMRGDLPAVKRLETVGLCDSDALLEKLDEAGAPSGRRIVVRMTIASIDLILLAMLILCICSIATGSFNPFIYFRF